jgi:hypothetical protein
VLSHANHLSETSEYTNQHSEQAQPREQAHLTLVLTVEFNESRSHDNVPRLIERGTVQVSEWSVGQRASRVPL